MELITAVHCALPFNFSGWFILILRVNRKKNKSTFAIATTYIKYMHAYMFCSFAIWKSELLLDVVSSQCNLRTIRLKIYKKITNFILISYLLQITTITESTIFFISIKYNIRHYGFFYSSTYFFPFLGQIKLYFMKLRNIWKIDNFCLTHFVLYTLIAKQGLYLDVMKLELDLWR